MKLWKFIENEINNNRKVILISVIERKGSSPGKAGYKIAVSDNNSLEGSIGGGVMEVNMVEYAKKILKEKSNEIFIKKQIHNPNAGQEASGLICSGEQTHAFIPIDSSNINTVSEIITCLEKGNSGILTLSQKGLEFIESDEKSAFTKCDIQDENVWSFSEVIGKTDTIYIFGGGHVSIPVSQIFKMLGFKVVVYDNRKDLSTIDKNIYADIKEIIDYKDAGKMIKDEFNSYVAIMTVSHAEDQLILKQMASKNLKYLGMIGSKNKVKKIFDALLSQGITQEQLDKVDAPMGIPVKCHTTEEIAVTIAAKVIQVKNE
ncbi:MAG: XdhC family protein [Bacteroidota bacterium]